MNFPHEYEVRMKEMLKDEYEAYEASYEKPLRSCLRINPLKVNEDPIGLFEMFDLQPVPWERYGYYYNPSIRPGKHPFHDAGLYYMQEASAMTPVAISTIQKGDFVLDLCAAPGGKSTQIASRLYHSGLLVSNEVHPLRAKVLASNIERMGIRNAIVTNESTSKMAQRFPNFFDRIFVDAPCSGEGMFKKEPAALQQWSLEYVEVCAKRQLDILEDAHCMLKPNGTITYSTCTFAPSENEQVIHAFLSRHPEYQTVAVTMYEGWERGNSAWCEQDERVRNGVRIWPHKVDGEGHFAIVLHKNGEGDSFVTKTNTSDRKLVKMCEELYREIGMDGLCGVPVAFGEQVYLLPFDMDLKGLKVVRCGLHIGTYKKNRVEPAHALALTLSKDMVRTVYECTSEEQAIQYLKGNTLSCMDEKGWCLVCYKGYSLGWGKASGGQIKNHYPKGLRWM